MPEPTKAAPLTLADAPSEDAEVSKRCEACLDACSLE